MTAHASFDDGVATLVITGVLTGTDHASADSLCRRLIDAGYDPALPLVAYRGSTLAPRVRSIGEGARFEVSHRGTGFVARCEGRPRTPIAATYPARTGHQTRLGAAP
jgi:hypothetical protein